MRRKAGLKASPDAALALRLATKVGADDMDQTSQDSFDAVMAFMGPGDMDRMATLMAQDLAWYNELAQ